MMANELVYAADFMAVDCVLNDVHVSNWSLPVFCVTSCVLCHFLSFVSR